MCRDHDDRWLARTLELAHRGAGRVEPNPRVGAVIVKAGEVVGTGYHRQYGGLHAEAAAFDAAGVGSDGAGTDASRDTRERVRGATLYCNLEPCSFRSPEKHHPPCTDAIIAAGVSRVVIAQRDPNPAVRGRGVRILREAGVVVDVLGEDLPGDPGAFLRENEVFNTFMALHRPFVHLKSALSLDGRVATGTGDSKWITDQSARRSAHGLRARYDAVLVGRGTVEADDPLLNVRLSDEPVGDSPGDHREIASGSPRAVVLDSSASISAGSRLVRERARELVVCVAPGATTDRRNRLEQQGVTVLECDSREGGGLEPRSVLDALSSVGIRSVMVEGGPRVVTSFLGSGLFDRVTFYFAPIILGEGRDAVGNLAIDRVSRALRFEEVRWQSIGEQQCFDGLRPGWRDSILSAGREQQEYGSDETPENDVSQEVKRVHRIN